MHGDPKLVSYVHGVKPDEKLHGTFVVIEPLSGIPISGEKKVQINVKLTQQPVELLSNVSEGFFPILWCKSVRKNYCNTLCSFNFKLRFRNEN